MDVKKNNNPSPTPAMRILGRRSIFQKQLICVPTSAAKTSEKPIFNFNWQFPRIKHSHEMLQPASNCMLLHTPPPQKKTHTHTLSNWSLAIPKRELSKKLSSKHHFIGAWFLFFWWEVPFRRISFSAFEVTFTCRRQQPPIRSSLPVWKKKLVLNRLNMSLIFPPAFGEIKSTKHFEQYDKCLMHTFPPSKKEQSSTPNHKRCHVSATNFFTEDSACTRVNYIVMHQPKCADHFAKVSVKTIIQGIQWVDLWFGVMPRACRFFALGNGSEMPQIKSSKWLFADMAGQNNKCSNIK